MLSSNGVNYVCLCICIIITLGPEVQPKLADYEIKDHLWKFLKKKELFDGQLVHNHGGGLEEFYQRYIDETTVSKVNKLVNLNEAIEASYLMETQVARLTFEEECDVAEHQEPRYNEMFQSKMTDEKRLEAWKTLTERPITKRYCNFLVYLRCSKKEKKCVCANNDLVWEVIIEPGSGKGFGRCVFKMGATCRDITKLDIDPAKKGEFLYFTKFDYVRERFVHEIDQECVKDVKNCNDICHDPEGSLFTWKLSDIAELLNRHIQAKDPKWTETERIHAMRWAMNQARFRDNRLTLSLEFESLNRLTNLDNTCNPTSDAEFKNVLVTSLYWNYIDPKDRQAIRTKYLKLLITKDVKMGSVCNHLQLHECKAGKCKCKSGKRDPTGKHCAVAEGQVCSAGEYTPKIIFNFQFEGTWEKPSLAKFFETVVVSCAEGFVCDQLSWPTSITMMCIEKTAYIQGLQKQFQDRFSLNLDDDCNFENQDKFFGKGAPDYAKFTFEQKKAKIQEIVRHDSPRAEFCRITLSYVCDEKTNKCTCTPNSFPDKKDKTKCRTQLTYTPCGHVKSEWYKAHDQLYLPADDLLRPAEVENMLCGGSYANCEFHSSSGGKVCQCNNLYGHECNIQPTRYTQFLDYNNFEATMHESRGRQIIQDLHFLMEKITERITLQLDTTCIEDHNKLLAPIIDFLRLARDCCSYDGNIWKCEPEPCPKSQGLPEFEAIKKQVDHLFKNEKMMFCDRTKGLLCISGKCQCEPTAFLQGDRCTLNFGMTCRAQEWENDPFHYPCRYLFDCDEKEKACTRGVSSTCAPLPRPSHPEFLIQAQQIYIDCLKKQVTEIEGLRRKGNGNQCNWQEELELKRAFQKYEELNNMNEFATSDDDRKRNIALIEPIKNALDLHMDVLYCSPRTPCDQETEICTDGKIDTVDNIRSQASVTGIPMYLLAGTRMAVYLR